MLILARFDGWIVWELNSKACILVDFKHLKKESKDGIKSVGLCPCLFGALGLSVKSANNLTTEKKRFFFFWIYVK